MCASVHTHKWHPTSSFSVGISLLLLCYKFKIWTACSKHFFSSSQVCMFWMFGWFKVGLALLTKIYFWSDSFSLHIFSSLVLYEEVADTCSVLFLWQLKAKDFFLIVYIDIPVTTQYYKINPKCQPIRAVYSTHYDNRSRCNSIARMLFRRGNLGSYLIHSP